MVPHSRVIASDKDDTLSRLVVTPYNIVNMSDEVGDAHHYHYFNRYQEAKVGVYARQDYAEKTLEQVGESG